MDVEEVVEVVMEVAEVVEVLPCRRQCHTGDSGGRRTVVPLLLVASSLWPLLLVDDEDGPLLCGL